MKNYYFNPKSQDLYIFDPQTKDMLVLERIEGIRVLTTSEIDKPVREEEGYHNHNWDPGAGKAKPSHRIAKNSPEDVPVKKTGQWRCKNCGELGHSAKTCKAVSRAAINAVPEQA